VFLLPSPDSGAPTLVIADERGGGRRADVGADARLVTPDQVATRTEDGAEPVGIEWTADATGPIAANVAFVIVDARNLAAAIDRLAPSTDVAILVRLAAHAAADLPCAARAAADVAADAEVSADRLGFVVRATGAAGDVAVLAAAVHLARTRPVVVDVPDDSAAALSAVAYGALEGVAGILTPHPLRVAHVVRPANALRRANTPAAV
jgi:hypothetical protein